MNDSCAACSGKGNISSIFMSLFGGSEICQVCRGTGLSYRTMKVNNIFELQEGQKVVATNKFSIYYKLTGMVVRKYIDDYGTTRCDIKFDKNFLTHYGWSSCSYDELHYILT